MCFVWFVFCLFVFACFVCVGGLTRVVVCGCLPVFVVFCFVLNCVVLV